MARKKQIVKQKLVELGEKCERPYTTGEEVQSKPIQYSTSFKSSIPPHGLSLSSSRYRVQAQFHTLHHHSSFTQQYIKVVFCKKHREILTNNDTHIMMFVARLSIVATLLLSQLILITQSLVTPRSTTIRSFLHKHNHRPIVSRNIHLYATANNDGERPTFFSNLRKQWSNLTSRDGNNDKSVIPSLSPVQSVSTKSIVRKLPKTKVVIVGAGLSGLACANDLTKNSMTDFLIMETSDGPGGRIRTDECEGFLLDRGFQVFIDSYPEAQELFDYPALQLRVILLSSLHTLSLYPLSVFSLSLHTSALQIRVMLPLLSRVNTLSAHNLHIFTLRTHNLTHLLSTLSHQPLSTPSSSPLSITHTSSIIHLFHITPSSRHHSDSPYLLLQSFLPGAVVRYDGAFHVVSDPFRRPQVLYNITTSLQQSNNS